MSGSPVLQVRVPPDALAGIDAARGGDSRSGWVLAVIERELSGPAPAAAAPVHAPVPVALGALQRGADCPGMVCAGFGCWERSTARYGLRSLPLCRACAAALTGEVHRSPVTPPRMARSASGR